MSEPDATLSEGGAPRPNLLSRALRAVVALSGATLLTQVLSIAVTPILSRLYGPEQFGTNAAVTSLVVPATQIAALQLASAVVVVPKDDDARPLVATGMFGGLIGGLVAGAIAMAAPGHDGATHWIVAGCATLAVVVNVFGGMASALVNRRKRYSVLAASRFAAAVVGTVLNLSLGFAAVGWWGLLVGYVAASATAAAWCGWVTRAELRAAVSATTMRVVAETVSRFRRYPLFVLPTELLNTLIRQAPIYALTMFATAAAVGAFGLGQSMLGLPLTLVGSAIGEVFSREAAETYAKHGSCGALFKRMAAALALLAIPLFSVIAIAGPWVFTLVFGEKWRAAGEYVRIMAGPMAMRFVASPLSAMYIIAERQREDLLLHVALGMLMVVALVGANLLGADSHGIVATCSGVMSAFYFVVFVRSWTFARGGRAQVSEQG